MITYVKSLPGTLSPRSFHTSVSSEVKDSGNIILDGNKANGQMSASLLGEREKAYLHKANNLS